MRPFSKRDTPAKNIAFLAMMVATNALASLLSAFVPLASVFVVIFLPLVSAFATSITEAKYSPIYILASIGICLGAGAYDIPTVIFYVIPAIVSGSTYGLLHGRKIPNGILIIIVTLVNFGLNLLALPIIKGIYGLDFIAFIKQVLGLSSVAHIDDIIPSAILAWSAMEAGLASLFIQFAFHKMGIDGEEDPRFDIAYPTLGIVSAGLGIGLAFLDLRFAYSFIALGTVAAFVSIKAYLKKQPWWIYALGVGLIVLSLMGFALLQPHMPDGSDMCLCALYIFSLCLPAQIAEFLPIIRNGHDEIH